MNPRHTTLWETWDGGVDDPNGSGRCHPMFGSVVAWFYRSLAGIRPDPTQPGMKHFRIEPTPVAGLTHCKASYQSLYGRIRSEWRVDAKGRFKLTVEIPANTSATVTLPPWGRATVLESGLTLDRVPAITVDKGPPVRMEVPSGVYHFTMRR
jgi:alpha-L-rhamnosidase